MISLGNKKHCFFPPTPLAATLCRCLSPPCHCLPRPATLLPPCYPPATASNSLPAPWHCLPPHCNYRPPPMSLPETPCRHTLPLSATRWRHLPPPPPCHCLPLPALKLLPLPALPLSGWVLEYYIHNSHNTTEKAYKNHDLNKYGVI